MSRHPICASLMLACALSAPLFSPAVTAGTLVDLNAEASRPAANDLLRATVFVETSDSNPAELARRVNAEIAQALKTLKARPSISVKSGQQHSYPVYGQNRRIETWRMRSELVLESRDTAALSEALGQLQQHKLAIGSLQQLPAPETRRQVEDDTTRDALQAFEARARLVATALGKPFRIKQLNIQQSGSVPPMPMPMARAAAMSMDAAPAPLEGGTSQLTTVIHGQIELGD